MAKPPNLTGKRVRYLVANKKTVEVEIIEDNGGWWIVNQGGGISARSRVLEVQVPLLTGMAWVPYWRRS